MGYTNYFYSPIVMDKEKFKTLSEELEVARGFMPGNSSSASSGNESEVAILCGWDGTGEPEFTESTICFNGDGARGLDHETFSINQDSTEKAKASGSKNGLVFDFCKTNRKPYDLMVQISMLRLKHHFPESEISSDGDASDWKNAKALYKKVFGKTPPKLNRD
jgi:hypothetical protein